MMLRLKMIQAFKIAGNVKIKRRFEILTPSKMILLFKMSNQSRSKYVVRDNYHIKNALYFQDTYRLKKYD